MDDFDEIAITSVNRKAWFAIVAARFSASSSKEFKKQKNMKTFDGLFESLGLITNVVQTKPDLLIDKK